MADMKTLKNRKNAQKFNPGWKVGTIMGGEKKGEFTVFYESNQTVSSGNKTEEGTLRVDKYRVLL